MKKISAVLLCVAITTLAGCKKTETPVVTARPAASAAGTGSTNHGTGGGNVIVGGNTSFNDSVPDLIDDEVIGDFETEPEDGALTLIKYHGTEEKVRIPAKIKGKTVRKVGEYAFRGVTTMKTLAIPSTVEFIETRAFTSCTALKNVTVEDGVKVIDDYAFSDCVNLEKVTLPDSVFEIGTGAFSNCPYVNVTYKGSTYTPVNMKELYEVF